MRRSFLTVIAAALLGHVTVDSGASIAADSARTAAAKVDDASTGASQGGVSPDRFELRMRRSKRHTEATSDPFVRHNWSAPSKAAAGPPQPRVFPFQFFGRFQPADAPAKLFLVKGDDLVIVSQGDVLDRDYRVDVIAEAAVEITYLPLQMKQRLDYVAITRPPQTIAQPSQSPVEAKALLRAPEPQRTPGVTASARIPADIQPGVGTTFSPDVDLAAIRSLFGRSSHTSPSPRMPGAASSTAPATAQPGFGGSAIGSGSNLLPLRPTTELRAVR